MSSAPARVSPQKKKKFPNLAQEKASGRPGTLSTEACSAYKLGPFAPVRVAEGSRARPLARARNQRTGPEAAAYHHRVHIWHQTGLVPRTSD